MLAALESRCHGRGKGLQALLDFLAVSENILLKDKQTTKQTLAKWLGECIKIGRKENSRHYS